MKGSAMTKETYLGDGLYANYDGYQISLRAPRDDGDHVVYLEPMVMNEFVLFVEKTFGISIKVEKRESEDATNGI